MKNKSLILNIILPIIIALTCFFPIASYTTKVEHHQKNIEYIDSKKTTVLELTATSAALSVALDMIPGDTGSSIANALASLTTKFGIVLGALYLEKYLLTLLAYVAFKWIIPICCGAWIIQYLLHMQFLKQMIIKIGVLALCMNAVIPVSIQVSKLIENTYSSSIQETIDIAQDQTEEIEENKNLFSSIVGTVQNGLSQLGDGLKNILNNFIEALAILIVTCCAIPIGVFIVFLQLIKMLTNINIEIPETKRLELKKKYSEIEEQ